MKKISKLFILLLMIVITIGSCKKEDDTTIIPPISKKNCKVATTEMSTNESNDTTLSIYEYTLEGNILKESDYINGVLKSYTVYDYSTSGIVEVKKYSASGYEENYSIYKLDSNGYASFLIDGNNQTDTLNTFEYNSNGNLIKLIDKTNGIIIKNTYTNGNRTQMDMDMLGLTFTVHSEYTDKMDKRNNGYFFTGKGSTHLCSKEYISFSLFSSTSTYTYTFNSDEYPLEAIMTTELDSISMLSKINYTYICQ